MKDAPPHWRILVSALAIPTTSKKLISEKSHKEITLAKPGFILRLLELEQRPLLWLDCDTQLKDTIDGIPWEGHWDAGFTPVVKGLGEHAKRILMRRRRRENSVAGFAIAVKPSPRCFEFLKVWEYLCRDPDVFSHSDHRRMTWALNITQPRKRNIAAALEKAMTVNAGKNKERSIAFYRFLPIA